MNHHFRSDELPSLFFLLDDPHSCLMFYRTEINCLRCLGGASVSSSIATYDPVRGWLHDVLYPSIGKTVRFEADVHAPHPASSIPLHY